MMLLLRSALLIAAACASMSISPAHPRGACPTHFLGGAEPTVPGKFIPKTHELCSDNFALLHSGLSRTALWSAERITRTSVTAARQLERTNEFYPDPRLSPSERSELSDYRRSGYDRGHLTPSGDMPTVESQAQSFTLANIVPQTANLNRHAWRYIESAIRYAAVDNGTAYVVTGPLFVGDRLDTLRGRVFIPTHIWKAAYVPGRGSVVYVATNQSQPAIEAITVSQFTQRYGINPFPALTGPARDRLLILR